MCSCSPEPGRLKISTGHRKHVLLILLIQSVHAGFEELLKSGNKRVVFAETNYQEHTEKSSCDVGFFCAVDCEMFVLKC